MKSVTRMAIMLLVAIMLPLSSLCEYRLDGWDIDSVNNMLHGLGAGELQMISQYDDFALYGATWYANANLDICSIAVAVDESGATRMAGVESAIHDTQFLLLPLLYLPCLPETSKEEISAWIKDNLDHNADYDDEPLVRMEGDYAILLFQIGALCVMDASILPDELKNDSVQVKFDHKPGIIGSNAYDLTIGAADTGFLDVGKCTRISDGYTWTITGTSNYGFYSIYIDANDSYELHRVTFTLSGKDTTFFPWAVTIPFSATDTERATTWVKDCQSNKTDGQLILGDAVWNYHPNANGDGGTLTLCVDTCDAYTDYMLDQLLQ